MFEIEGYTFGPETLVNSYLPNDQKSPQEAALAGGGYVIAWESAGQDGSGYGIYAQQYDATGARVGGETLVNTTTLNSQRSPAIAALNDGGYVVAWNTEIVGFTTVTGLGVSAQRFDAGGRKLGAEIHVNTYPDSGQDGQSVTGLADGGYLIVWMSVNGASTQHLYGQRYLASGVAVGGEVRIDDDPTVDPAVVTTLSSGDVLVAWQGYHNNQAGIVTQLLDPSGARIGDETIVNLGPGGSDTGPEVTALVGDRYLVSWQQGSGSGSTIRGQIFSDTGVSLSGPVTLESAPSGLQSTTALPDGGFVVAWDGFANGDPNGGVFSQRFDSFGNALGSPSIVVSAKVTEGLAPSVVALSNGDYDVAYSKYVLSEFGYDVFHQTAIRTLVQFSFDGSGAVLQDTAAGLAGASVLDWNVGDILNITDADPTSFSYARLGSRVTLSSGQTFTLSNNPAGHFFVSADPNGGVDLKLVAPVPVASDFNGDGHSDLLWREAGGTFATWDITGNVSGAVESRNVDFDSSVSTAWQVQGTLDFNGDGAADILWRNTASGAFSIWTAHGNAFTQNAYFDTSVPTNWNVSGLGDFNGDGRSDILWRSASGDLSEWQSTGTGFVQNAFTAHVDPSWRVAGVGDFNGDGQSDILWRNVGGALSEWQSTGNGFSQNVYYDTTVGTSWHVEGVADFNGDGQADILWRNDSGLVSIWTSTGSGFTQNTFTEQVDNGWRIIATGDFNGDGLADILWRNDNGTIDTWQSNGHGGFTENVLVDSTVPNNWTLQTTHYDFV